MHVRPSEENPVLLIIDGHSSHTKNLAFTEKARANHETVLVLPPHCSNKLQPLDVSFMAPFKTYYANAVEDFMREKVGHVVSQYDIAELMGKAFTRAAKMEIAVSGFRKTGIHPLDETVFDEDSFAPSLVTDQPVSEVIPSALMTDQPTTSFDSSVTDQPVSEVIPSTPMQDQPTTSFVRAIKKSHDTSGHETQSDTAQSLDGSFTVSPSSILPLPKMTVPRATKRRRPAEKTAEITSDQYKDTLKKAKASKEIKDMKKTRKKGTRKPKTQKSAQIEEDILCFKCGSIFSDSEEGRGWFSCYKCGKWFHDDCEKENQGKCLDCC